MGIALLFFATAVRNLLRSGEAREATYSSVAYAGWIVVVAGLSQMVMWDWGLINGAADAKNDAGPADAELRGLLRLGGDGHRPGHRLRRDGARWPAQRRAAEVVRRRHRRLGVLGALGNAGIPPGGLVTYVLLPFWLIAASVIVARRSHRAAAPELVRT